jgi:SagB-type dehydrogenase family enzyme
MTERPLTIRLDGEDATVSGDDGESWTLSGRQAIEVRRICSETSTGSGPSVSPLSAAALGTLAEASAIRTVAAPEGSSLVEDAACGTVECRVGGLELMHSRALRVILLERQSARAYDPPTLPELATVLVRAGRVRGWRETPEQMQEQTRALPSAGACYPIELEVVTGGIAGLTAGRWTFDAARCVLRRLEVSSDPGQLIGSLEERGFDVARGHTAIITVAHFDRTLRRYPNGASLVWRDAGVALAGLHLCATDIGLASCILADVAPVRGHQPYGPVDVGALLLGRALRQG